MGYIIRLYHFGTPSSHTNFKDSLNLLNHRALPKLCVSQFRILIQQSEHQKADKHRINQETIKPEKQILLASENTKLQKKKL